MKEQISTTFRDVWQCKFANNTTFKFNRGLYNGNVNENYEEVKIKMNDY